MNNYVRGPYLVLTATNTAFSLLSIMMFVNIRASVIFDLDKVRVDVADSVEYVWRRGCLEAAEEYDRTVTTPGFNLNSPQMWCHTKLEQNREWLTDIVVNAGKRK
jgi:hypothetical protein